MNKRYPIISITNLANEIQCLPKEFSFSNLIVLKDQCYLLELTDTKIREISRDIVWSETRDIPIFVKEYENTLKAIKYLKKKYPKDEFIIVKGK